MVYTIEMYRGGLKNPQKLANKKGHGRKISYPQELEDNYVMDIREARREVCCC